MQQFVTIFFALELPYCSAHNFCFVCVGIKCANANTEITARNEESFRSQKPLLLKFLSLPNSHTTTLHFLYA